VFFYNNALSNKDTAINVHRGQRGVYLWTHIASGKQYIGSSKNLGIRLADYYRPSYLNIQSTRGSLISRALLKHGHAAFSLSIVTLGPTLTDQEVTSTNLPDFVVLEQSYLDSCDLLYNVNRIASSAAYTQSTSLVNVGVNNPSYGLTGENSFVWGRSHSELLKSLWSSTRSKYTFFVYDRFTFLLLETFTSASQLARFIPDVSKRFGTDIAKYLKGINSPAVIYGEYILSMVELTSEEIEILLPNMTVKPVTLPRPVSPTGKYIYGYNPNTNVYQTWNSLEKCVHALTGNRFENKATVNKRINKGILFHGYLLQTNPFD
jgi:group I intron endonuclease